MYLGYDELSDLQKESVTEEQFNKYIEKAQDIVDYVTGHYWLHRDFKSVIPTHYLVKQTKKAVYSQVVYFVENEGSSIVDFQVPSSFSAGRTSITNRSSQTEQKLDLSTLISPEVYMHLEGTGLMYRGVNNPYYRGNGWDWL